MASLRELPRKMWAIVGGFVLLLSVTSNVSSSRTKDEVFFVGGKRDQHSAFTSSTRFYKVVPCNKNTVCAEAELKIGTPVTLLKENESETCLAKAVAPSSVTYYDDGEEVLIKATRLESATCKGELKHYFLAVATSVVNKYQLVSLQRSENPKTIAMLDGMAYKHDLVTEADKDLQSSEAYSFSLSGKQIFIRNYKSRDNSGYVDSTPIIIFSYKKPLAVIDSCSSIERIFSIDGDFYLQAHIGCCECGGSGTMLMRITQSNVEGIFSVWP